MTQRAVDDSTEAEMRRLAQVRLLIIDDFALLGPITPQDHCGSGGSALLAELDEAVPQLA
ncbi:hypothetical protein [Mycobacterium camsae]|uniref:hypothetical protein n=1 Tax=Mycobacterium gordonae TaxID=1778 RepID=UPI00197E2403|nr:hypothetical protein [Mycobacterium gordonae]